MKPQQFVDNGIDNKAFDNCDENVTNVGSGRTINTISQDTNDEEKAQENPKSIAGNNTFIYLFRTRRMTQVTIVMMVLWLVPFCKTIPIESLKIEGKMVQVYQEGQE